MVMLFSCQKDKDDLTNEKIERINEARSWYDVHYPTELSLNLFNDSKGAFKAKPDWSKATTNYSNDRSKTVEIPLFSMGRFGFATLESKTAYLDSSDKRYMQSVTRLVIKSQEDSYSAFFMTIIPHMSYQKKTNFNAFTSSYRKWKNGFSGYVFYHNLKGDFTNGWEILEGKVIRTVKENKKRSSEGDNSKSTTLVCYDTFLLIWYEDCTEWFTNGVYTHTTCGPGYLEMESWYTICEYVDLGGGGGEGGEEPTDRPCDGDPILNMSVAPTTLNGDAITGMYGCVRYSAISECDINKKLHGGIDIACPTGTPVYNMRYGEVIDMVDSYPPDSEGEDNPRGRLGNFVKIRFTTIDNTTIDYYYAHLNYVYVGLGDIVDYNDVIGLSGKTGNAHNVPNPHVHIQIKENDTLVDPTGYFNSTISPSGEILNQCIRN